MDPDVARLSENVSGLRREFDDFREQMRKQHDQLRDDFKDTITQLRDDLAKTIGPRLNAHAKRLDEQERRVGSLERWRSWLAGAIAAIPFVGGFLAWLFFSSGGPGK